MSAPLPPPLRHHSDRNQSASYSSVHFAEPANPIEGDYFRPHDSPRRDDSTRRRSRAGSLVAGKRASVVTGGYESSSGDERDHENGNGHGHAIGPGDSPKRRRAMSLIQTGTLPGMERSGSDKSLTRRRNIGVPRLVAPHNSLPPSRVSSMHSSRSISFPNGSAMRAGIREHTPSPDRDRDRDHRDRDRRRKDPRRDVLTSSLLGTKDTTLTAGTL